MSQSLLLLLVGIICVAEQARAYDLNAKDVKDAIDVAYAEYTKLENGEVTTNGMGTLQFALHDGSSTTSKPWFKASTMNCGFPEAFKLPRNQINTIRTYFRTKTGNKGDLLASQVKKIGYEQVNAYYPKQNKRTTEKYTFNFHVPIKDSQLSLLEMLLAKILQ